MAKKSAADAALAWALKTHKLRDALIVDHAQALEIGRASCRERVSYSV